MTRLEGKTCLVTGAAHGIGKATCKRLADEGAVVAATDVTDGDGQALVDEIMADGGKAVYHHLDVTDEAQVESVFETVAKEHDGLDVIVNNAGISGSNAPTDQHKSADWAKVMDVNVNGVFYCTRAAIPLMRKRGGGSIINLSSIYGIIGAPDIPPYHASKGAVREMSKTDAIQYAKEGIRVNSVHPGFIWTPLVEQMGQESEEGVDAFRAGLDKLHPVGHVGEAGDIAAGVAYLASDDAKFVTGSELVIDGGYTAQ